MYIGITPNTPKIKRGTYPSRNNTQLIDIHQKNMRCRVKFSAHTQKRPHHNVRKNHLNWNK